MIRKTNETYIEIINSKEMNIETGDPVLNHLLKTLFLLYGKRSWY